EAALLELWRQPAAAIRTLYRLHRMLGQELRERLAMLADWDSPRQQSGVVYLPWKEAEQPVYVRWMLARLGFGGRAEADIGALRLPVQLALALGVCAGMAV